MPSRIPSNPPASPRSPDAAPSGPNSPSTPTTPAGPVSPANTVRTLDGVTSSDGFTVAGTSTASVKTWFAPYDDPIKQEIALIEELLSARRADPREFAPGENPYKIQYAVYNLRNPDVVRLLTEAHHGGVDVQILIEQDQLDPAKTWNTADDELIASGFRYSHTNKGLTAEEREALNLIGIEGSGLMHLKTRIFTRPDPQTGKPIEKLLTGSMNPGDEAVRNFETLHLVQDPQLIERYRAKVQSVLEGRKIANEWKDGAPVNVLFTPASAGPQPSDKILQMIDQEQEAIFLTMFSLRNFTGKEDKSSLLDKLAAAKARGVEICIVTDRKQSDGIDGEGNRVTWNDKTEDQLRALGIPVYECINEAGPFNAMHNKSAVFGLTNMKVVTDCGNWTNAGLGGKNGGPRNDESFLFIDSKQLDGNATGLRYLSNFLQLLRTYQHQQVDGEPNAKALFDRFSQHPAWPKVKVDFNVVASTYFGQEVYITGNHPALGDWTRAGPGLKLNTHSVTYPAWRTDASLELPFGTSLEYKVIKRDEHTGHIDWQHGKNELLIVDTGDLRVDGRDGTDALKVDGRFDR